MFNEKICRRDVPLLPGSAQLFTAYSTEKAGQAWDNLLHDWCQGREKGRENLNVGRLTAAWSLLTECSTISYTVINSSHALAVSVNSKCWEQLAQVSQCILAFMWPVSVRPVNGHLDVGASSLYDSGVSHGWYDCCILQGDVTMLSTTWNNTAVSFAHMQLSSPYLWCCHMTKCSRLSPFIQFFICIWESLGTGWKGYLLNCFMLPSLFSCFAISTSYCKVVTCLCHF